jgi:peptidoglycan hydrolase CwlO-like protein
MADLTDEEALTGAEQALWQFRALSKLEEVVRYVRNSRKDVTLLQQQIQDLNAEVIKSQTQCEEWAAKLQRTAAETSPVIEELTNRKATLGEEVRKLEVALATGTTSAELLAKRVADDQARSAALQERIADLNKQAKLLEETITQRETKLAELRSLAAKMSE